MSVLDIEADGAFSRVLGALIDGDHHLVFADPQDVSVVQFARRLLRDRVLGVIQIRAVGARILEHVQAMAEQHAGVPPRQEAGRVWQDPVVVCGTPDRAASHTENDAAAAAEDAPVFTHDTQP
jgi:hypothetical protein